MNHSGCRRRAGASPCVRSGSIQTPKSMPRPRTSAAKLRHPAAPENAALLPPVPDALPAAGPGTEPPGVYHEDLATHLGGSLQLLPQPFQRNPRESVEPRVVHHRQRPGGTPQLPAQHVLRQAGQADNVRPVLPALYQRADTEVALLPRGQMPHKVAGAVIHADGQAPAAGAGNEPHAPIGLGQEMDNRLCAGAGHNRKARDESRATPAAGADLRRAAGQVPRLVLRLVTPRAALNADLERSAVEDEGHGRSADIQRFWGSVSQAVHALPYSCLRVPAQTRPPAHTRPQGFSLRRASCPPNASGGARQNCGGLIARYLKTDSHVLSPTVRFRQATA